MAPTLKLRSDRVLWREVDDEVVALDLGGEKYLSINRTGAALWSALAAGATTERLADELVERFGADAAEARVDVAAFVADLRARGLLDA
jgi:hypothetical protein